MPIKVKCPQCQKSIRVADEHAGRKGKCPNCHARIEIPAADIPSQERTGSEVPFFAKDRQTLPADMPPMPSGDGEWDDLGNGFEEFELPPSRVHHSEHPVGVKVRESLTTAAETLNLADMFLGNEKEYVFGLIPGEERIRELTIRHLHLFIVRSGVTRLTLTTNRLLFTNTRVFSPTYWLLLLLFPPLIWYYIIRVSLNRNVAIPLESIDSIEKRYRVNWLWFVLAVFIGAVCRWLVGTLVDEGAQRIIIYWVATALLAPVVLILLLKTRIPQIKVVTHNDSFRFSYGVTDLGADEQAIDAFLRSVHTQLERKKRPQSQQLVETPETWN